MTVKDLRTLVDNLDEYIHVPNGIERLKKTILHLAVSGKLVPQDPSEGTGQDLYDKIQKEKQKLKAEGKLKKQQQLPNINEDEAYFDIPETWKWARLGDLTTLIGDGLHGTPQYSDGEYYFINGNNLGQEQIVIKENTKTVSEKEYLKYKKDLNNQTVLLSINGTIGNVSYFNGENIVLSKSAAYMNLCSEVEKRYIGLLLSSSYILDYYHKTRSGTTIYNLSLQSIRELPVALPPRIEQQNILAKVGEIFNLIESLTEKYTAEQDERTKLVTSSFSKFSKGKSMLALSMLTEIVKSKEDAVELRKTILQLAISGKLVPQNPSEGTGQELYNQIQVHKSKLVAEGKLRSQNPLAEISEEEIPFKIPDNWKWVRLADATVFSIGRTPARKEGSYWDEEYMPWVSIADLKSGQKISKTKERISKKAFDKCFSNGAVPAGSLLYSFKLTIGKMSITEMDAVHNEAIASFSTYSDEMTHYLFKALEVIDPTKRSKGAIMGRTLNSTSLSLLEIPLPPLAEQARIVKKTTQLLDLVSRLESYLE